MKIGVFFLLLSLIAAGCLNNAQKRDVVVCNPPYMRVGAGCCLDQDDNRVCDKDEATTTLPENTAPTTTQATSTTLPATTQTTQPSTTLKATTTQPAPSPTTTQTTQPPAPTTTLYFPCMDSDGGDNVYLKGTVTKDRQYGTDKCLGSAMIREYYCVGDQGTSRSHECPMGCLDGRCLGCVDTDGGDDPNTYGEVTLGNTLLKKDICSNRDGVTLTEFYCVNHEEIGSRQVVCTTSCAGGYCH